MSLCIHPSYIGYSITINDTTGVTSVFQGSDGASRKGCSSAGRCAFEINCAAASGATSEAASIVSESCSGGKSCFVLERSGKTVHGSALPTGEVACSESSGPSGLEEFEVYIPDATACPEGLVDVLALSIGVSVAVAVLAFAVCCFCRERLRRRFGTNNPQAKPTAIKCDPVSEKAMTNPVRAQHVFAVAPAAASISAIAKSPDDTPTSRSKAADGASLLQGAAFFDEDRAEPKFQDTSSANPLVAAATGPYGGDTDTGHLPAAGADPSFSVQL